MRDVVWNDYVNRQDEECLGAARVYCAALSATITVTTEAEGRVP